MCMIRIMGKGVSVILVAASIFGLPLGALSGQTRSVVEGNTSFALDLFSQLKASPGNLFFSPYSVSTALAMTYAGARGETERQMARVLHFDKEQPQLHSAFGELQRQLAEAGKQKGLELSIANALWAQKGRPFLPAFLGTAKGAYQANINQADFRTAAEAARAEINRWVEGRTRDKIQEILPAGSVSEVTGLVLANALYFKGVWAKPFRKSDTSTQPFHLTMTSQVDVPLMHRFDELGYMENSDSQAVELPYGNGALSLVVLLPRQVEGCGKLENQLSPALLSRSLGQMGQRNVEIFLPRFKLELAVKLNSTLAQMGMPSAFGPQADFSGMDSTKSRYLSGVFHKAWGEVNEEGTEAAAATAVVLNHALAVKPLAPSVFRADHPFIFLIRDTRSGSLLFLGRLADPAH